MKNGFIPATIHLPSTTKEMINVHVDPFYETLPHIGYMVNKHGDNTWPARVSRSLEDHSLKSHSQRASTLPMNEASIITFNEKQGHRENHSQIATFSLESSTSSTFSPSFSCQPTVPFFEKPKNHLLLLRKTTCQLTILSHPHHLSHQISPTSYPIHQRQMPNQPSSVCRPSSPITVNLSAPSHQPQPQESYGPNQSLPPPPPLI